MPPFSLTTTSSSSPCLPQRRRFSSTHHHPLQGLRAFSFRSRMRRTLICAINQDGLTDTLRTADPYERTPEDSMTEDPIWLAKDEDKVELEALLQNRSSTQEAWSQFSKRVSGEWDGFGADFSNEGTTIELPETVVPEAYREWEVKVFDWQTQCPTLADPEENILAYKNIYLLPTVGCEADAATRYKVDERQVGGANSAVSAFAYQSSGSYVAVWQKEDKLLELEYCLINPQDSESRVRIFQLLNVSDNMKMTLRSIKVFRELWYGPFRNGDQLGGCAIRDSAFASTPPMAGSQVAGVWHGSRAIATFGTSNTGVIQELLDDNMQNCVRDGSTEILLPKQLWCSFNQSQEGESRSEVGWLLDHGQAITSSCLFSSTAKLKEISVALETKAEDL